MRSKSESDMKLDGTNRDVGAENEIFTENVPDQTGYNI